MTDSEGERRRESEGRVRDMNIASQRQREIEGEREIWRNMHLVECVLVHLIVLYCASLRLIAAP